MRSASISLVLPRGNAAFLLQRLQRLAHSTRQRAVAMKQPITHAAALSEAVLFDGMVTDLRTALAR